jgi:hypothetical protein
MKVYEPWLKKWLHAWQTLAFSSFDGEDLCFMEFRVHTVVWRIIEETSKKNTQPVTMVRIFSTLLVVVLFTSSDKEYEVKVSAAVLFHYSHTYGPEYDFWYE